ncbi:MAG: adenylate/guanylate cyclase domain-containing protein [Cyanobacteria bacterium P01_G01_bin.54]
MKLLAKSLRTRLISYFSLLSLATVSTVGCLTFLGARVVIKRLVFDRLRVSAQLKEQALNLWVENQKEATIAIAQLSTLREEIDALIQNDRAQPTNESNHPESSGLNSGLLQSIATERAYERVARSLTSALASRPELGEVYILDKVGGRVVFSTNKDQEGDYRLKDTYFQEGLQQTYVQPVYPSPINNRPTITVATPIVNPQDQVVAVMAVNLSLDQLERIVRESVSLGDSAASYLVDRYNSLVSSDRLGQTEYPRGLHSLGIDSALAGQTDGKLYPNYAGDPVIGYFLWLETLEVALLVETNQTEAFRPARYLAWGIFGIGTVSVLCVTGGVYWLSTQVVRPIVAIKDAAIQVAQGDLEQMAPVMTQDEVGILAQAFNQMTQRLQELYAGLEEKVLQLETAEKSLRQSLKDLEIEQARSEQLLLNTLPQSIAYRLKSGVRNIADSYDNVTVLFADLVMFTQLSERLPPQALVTLLNKIFSVFDQLSEQYNLEKIKTIGDAYMVVGGLPEPHPHHAQAIAAFALDILATVNQLDMQFDESLNIRIGIHSGSVVAGVIGIKKFTYDLWGDTVNLAARMESQGVAGRIQVTAETYELLREQFVFEERGTVEVKGKAPMKTYFLVGRQVNVD